MGLNSAKSSAWCAYCSNCLDRSFNGLRLRRPFSQKKLGNSSLYFLKRGDQIQEVSRLRVAIGAEDTHEAFRRPEKCLPRFDKPHCPVNVFPENHLCRVEISSQHVVYGLAKERAAIVLLTQFLHHRFPKAP